MKTYNYFEEICDDVRNYIEENEIEVTEENREDVEDLLNERLWLEDSVTGNGSGSYTFSRYQAEENLCHNMHLLIEASVEWGADLGNWVEKGAEFCDVTIRCYLLRQCISAVLSEIV